MKLTEMIEPKLMKDMLDGGFVRYQDHGTLPLRIFNYTPRAQYERVWNDATKRCRGLIVNTNTLDVEARPFAKFFNLAEHNGDVPNEPFQVFDKLDGSLGILYRGKSIATRGAFESPQAEYATDLFQTRYHGFKADPRLTYLVEIIYPQNRIVVDYGDTADLFLLAAIDTESGKEVDGVPWPGPRVEPLAGFSDLPSVVASQRPNAEGYVLRFESGFRVKVKHDEYVRLHKLLTGISSVTIWELLATGQSLDAILECVPDEFYQWVKQTAAELVADFQNISSEVERQFRFALAESGVSGEPTRESRKMFAMSAMKQFHKSALFSLLDGKPCDEYVWKQIRPTRTVPFRCGDE